MVSHLRSYQITIRFSLENLGKNAFVCKVLFYRKARPTIPDGQAEVVKQNALDLFKVLHLRKT